jgi:hypothetical protein
MPAETCLFCICHLESAQGLTEHVWHEHLVAATQVKGYKRCWCGRLLNENAFFAHILSRGGCFAHRLECQLEIYRAD